MIIDPNYKPSQEDFEEFLQAAIDGEFRSDTGLSDTVQEALWLVFMAAPTVPKELIEAARLAFKLSN